jgi:transketolase
MLRDGDDFIGMDGFGASGPGGALFEHFGITTAAIAGRARALIA